MIEQQLDGLHNMTNKELKDLYKKYFNCTLKNRPREFYIENIAYRMQELEYGGLTMPTRRLLERMYEETKNGQPKRRITPVGTKIIKNYKGTDYVVRVLEHGYDLDGHWFKTLSGVTRRITGMKISGSVFFNIGKWGK